MISILYADDFLDRAFDGSITTFWRGQPQENSSAVWIGARAVPDVKCIRFYQGFSNVLRPAGSVKLQYRLQAHNDGAWITLSSTAWDAGDGGWHTFIVAGISPLRATCSI